MIKIPTLRSPFSFEQFETVLQKLAHKTAIEAVTNPQGDIRIVIHDGRLSTVETNKHSIRFFASHISYDESDDNYRYGWKWGFDVEDKLYLTSNDRTKISFYSPEEGVKYDKEWHKSIDQKKTEAEKKRREKKILEFIEKLMSEASIKPVPRFALAKVAHSK